MNNNNKMNRGFITEALIVAGLIGTIGLAWGAHKIDDYISTRANEAAQQAADAARAEVEDSLGAYGITGGGTYRLKASIGTTGTTINLSSFKEPVSDINYTMTYLDTGIAYGTIDPLTDRPEFISFTGITQNSDGSAVLTGVTRGLTRTPQGEACTASTTLAVRHPGQAVFILSDSPCHFAEYAVTRNDEIITGIWTGPTPTNASQFTIKSYVDGLVNGGTVSTDKITVSATGGETLATGTIVYFNIYEAEWRKTDADTASTSDNVIIGIAQGVGADGGAISGGVLLKGIDTNQGVTLTQGQTLYLSGTAGATSTSAGTISKKIGIAKDTNEFYFDPSQVDEWGIFHTSTSTNQIALRATSTNATTTNLHVSGAFTGPTPSREIFDASGTWTKPTATGTAAFIQAWGGGGGGGRAVTTADSGGGGGGGYSEKWVFLSSLSSTETVTIGAGGAAATSNGVAASAGGNTTFGSHLTAYGGGGAEEGGGGGGGTSGAGATASAGTGGVGGGPDGGAAGAVGGFGGGGGGSSAAGGASGWGGGGGGMGNNVGGASLCGGGGGGGHANGAGAAGGVSTCGGSGGAGSAGGSGTTGVQPGGGGGSSAADVAGAPGGAGRIIITIF